MFKALLGTDYYNNAFFRVTSPGEFVVTPSEFHYYGTSYFGSEFFNSGLFMQPTALLTILRPGVGSVDSATENWQSTENTIPEAIDEVVLDRDDYAYTTTFPDGGGNNNTLRLKFDLSNALPAPGTDIVVRVDIGGSLGKNLWVLVIPDITPVYSVVHPLGGTDTTITITIPYEDWKDVADWSYCKINFIGTN